MSHDDAALIARVLEGDDDAFALLYDKYARLVRAVCYDTVGNLSGAQDLAQEVFLRAYERLGSLRSPDRLGPWLVAMSRNVCREYRRSRARDRHILVGLAPEDEHHTLNEEGDPRIDDLLAAIEKLGEQERLALRAYYLQGQNAEEAIKTVGMSRSSFYRLLERARKRLQELLSETED